MIRYVKIIFPFWLLLAAKEYFAFIFWLFVLSGMLFFLFNFNFHLNEVEFFLRINHSNVESLREISVLKSVYRFLALIFCVVWYYSPLVQQA
jgi:hypothetical protein